jgi:hypothetical protein
MKSILYKSTKVIKIASVIILNFKQAFTSYLFCKGDKQHLLLKLI